MTNSEEFYRELENMLELDPEAITGTEELADLGWDSMTLVMFIAMADEKFKAAVAPSKLAEAKTVAHLLALVSTPAP